MSKLIYPIISLLLFSYTSASAANPPAITEKPPLTIKFLIDPRIVKETSTKEVENNLRETVEDASRIFFPQVGRRLIIKEISTVIPFSLPIDDEGDYSGIYLLDKLGEMKKTADFLIIVSAKKVKRFEKERANGIANRYDWRAVIKYSNNTLWLRNLLLHEIGHICGPDHSEDGFSIMNPVVMFGMNNYDPVSLAMIKENCGWQTIQP